MGKLLADPDQGVIAGHGLFLYGWSGPGRMDGWLAALYRAAADQPSHPSALRAATMVGWFAWSAQK
jgi:hypothetical protein